MPVWQDPVDRTPMPPTTSLHYSTGMYGPLDPLSDNESEGESDGEHKQLGLRLVLDPTKPTVRLDYQDLSKLDKTFGVGRAAVHNLAARQPRPVVSSSIVSHESRFFETALSVAQVYCKFQAPQEKMGCESCRTGKCRPCFAKLSKKETHIRRSTERSSASTIPRVRQ